MFTTLFSLSLFIALIRSVLAQSDFTIDTPSFVQVRLTVFQVVPLPIFLPVPTSSDHLDGYQLPSL